MALVREPYGFVHADPSPLKEVYGGPTGQVFVECMRIRPSDVESKTVILFSHPIGGGSFLPLVNALARAGRHVVYCNPRYRGNDTALIMEKVVADLGAYVRHAREVLGYERVVLCGWSGGGSLATFYQQQAERPTLHDTPSGEAYDLQRFALQPADALMFVAAHTGRARRTGPVRRPGPSSV